MKKITLLILTFLLSFSGFSQVLDEGFEGLTFPPTTPGNWAVFQNGFGSNVWTTNTLLPHTGTKAAQINSRQNIGMGNTSKDFLATPLVTVPANGQLRFWARTAVNGNQGTRYQIRVASGALPANQTDETAYTALIQEWTEDELSLTYNIYEEKVVDLAAYAGQQIYIAFVDEYTQTGPGLSGDSWLLDDVKLVSQCFDPTGLTAGTFTLNSAVLSWGNPSGATSWEIEILPAASTPTGFGAVINTNPYTATAETTAPFTPLQEGTSYKYYVKALCTAVGSQWVGPFTFSTATAGSTCLAPIVVPSTLPYVTNSDTGLYGNNIAGPQGAGCAGGATNYMTGNDVVYSYTPTVTGPITITMTSSLANSSIYVYNSCANIGVNCLAGVANTTAAPRVIVLTVTAGQTYYIVISKRLAPVAAAYNLTIVANTCTNLAATFNVVNDCANGPQFFVTANVTNMGSATSILATDNQASAPQTITAPGVIQFGPFPNGTNVTVSLQNEQDANCFKTSANQTQAFCPATNNLCANAIPIACGGTETQTTVGATTTGAPTGTCGTTAGSGGLWYSYVGTGDVVTFSLCGSAYDTKIQIVTGACGAFTCVAGNDNLCGNQSQVLINSVLGVNYYVYVFGSGTSQGVFALNVSCVAPPPPPANDNCDTAIIVPTNPTQVCAQNVAGTTLGATPSTPLAITPCLGTADDDVWFEFVATATTHVINLSNIVGGTTDLNHIVYSGNVCGTLTQLYCSDANGSIASNLTIGDTYKIRVYTSLSVVNQSATFNVCITVPPTNDECAAAIPTPVNTALQCDVFALGSIAGATASAEASTCVGTEDDDVWFSFVATSIKHVLSITNIVGTTTNLNHAVYSGVCGSLVQKYCSVAGSLTSTNATYVIGQTYYIRVWSNGATFQTVDFNLCITTPIPPPACLITNQPAGNTCSLATPICNFNGYCGNTSASYTSDSWSQLSTAFCGSLENNSFLSFVATSSTISLNVWVTSTQLNYGIQMMVFSAATCGSGPVTSYTCWNPGNVPSDSSTVTATGLTPGNTYYIMIDGYAGDVCDYVIAPVTGSGSGIFTQVGVTSPTTTICLGQSATLTATGGGGTYDWSPASGLSAITGSSVVFTPTAVGSYTITATSTDGNPSCPLADVDSETIVVTAPTIATFNPIAPICVNSTAPLLPPTSIEGFTGTWSPAIVDNTQTAVYNFTPNPGQCADSTPVPLTVTVNSVEQVPTFNAIAPICANSIAPILPTTSIEGFTGTWFPSTIDNTTNGSYLFTPDAGQCATTFSLPVIVNTTASPTATVTVQPTCIITTGTIEITEPLGATLEYSIDGTTYQTGTAFPLLAPATYNVTVRDINTGCVSLPIPLTVNPIPAPPVAPTASVTFQPACLIPTGTIEVTAPTGATLEYSIDGTTYQTGTVFTGLTPATYNVTVRDINTGCVSAVTPLTVNPVLEAPAAPTGSVTFQPTCITTTGTIEITAPIGANLEYSVNGTVYQAGTVFTGLLPGTYNVNVRDTSIGCISPPTPFTINPIPDAPVAPSVNVILQPTCTTTGIIEVANPLGATLEYSIDGTTYQAGTVFTGLLPGTYNVTVRDINTGCVSSPTPIVILTPIAPNAPTAMVTTLATCNTQTGTITISSPLGVNYEYNVDGLAYQSSEIFTGLSVGQHIITVREINTGCVSSLTTIVILDPVTPNAAILLVSAQPTCAVPTGTIELTAPLGSEYEYSIDGGTSYQTSATFNSLNPGSHSILVRDVNTGCVSTASAIVVDPIPTPISITIEKGCVLGAYTLTALPNDANLDYEWFNEANVSVGNESTLVVTDSEVYKVVVTSPQGCVSQNTVDVLNTLCQIPKGISPNNDGDNDDFDLTGFNVKKVSIFNRYGTEVYTHGEGYTNQWTGQSQNGNELPDGTYYFVIVKGDGITATGWIYINR